MTQGSTFVIRHTV